MRKVLIIAYYWPPAGGGGVQRWLKFTKYLPEFGWDPIVYVPYNPQYPLRDSTLTEKVPDHVQVIKGHIWEARRIYRRLKKFRHGSKWSAPTEMDTLFFRDPGKLSWFGRLSLFLRSNMFVPDSRSLWIRPSVRRLRKWLSHHPVDLIISTGPPHSCHLIGMKLMQRTGIPWIADFRDPFLVLATQNPIEQEGTYPLPEAQVDRFMLKLVVGYPTRDEERKILERMASGQPAPTVSRVATVEQILEARTAVAQLFVDQKASNYIVDLVQATRDPKAAGVERLDGLIEHGASPRASIALMNASKAHAFLQGRQYVTPHDVKSMAMPVLRHRVAVSYEAEAEGMNSEDVIGKILDSVLVP